MGFIVTVLTANDILNFVGFILLPSTKTANIPDTSKEWAESTISETLEMESENTLADQGWIQNPHRTK